MLSDKQKEIYNKMDNVEDWEVLEVIREWAKSQIRNEKYYLGIDSKSRESEFNSSEFLIAAIYNLLKD